MKLVTELKKEFAVIAVLFGFALVPLPGIEGNPTGFQIAHDHAEHLILKNQEAVTITMDAVTTRDDIKSAEFKIHLNKQHLYNLYRLKDQMPETERQIEIDKTRSLIEKFNKDLEDARKKLRSISELWPDYQIAIDYRYQESDTL